LLLMKLWFSLHENIDKGVALNDVWQAVYEFEPDFELLAAKSGFTVEQLMMIDSYKGSASICYCINPEQLTRLFCEDVGGFELQQLSVPSYEFGECCPTIVLKRKR